MNTIKIHVQGAVANIKVDAEGESKVTFSIPLSHVQEIAKLSLFTQKLLDITVSVSDDQKDF